MRLFSAHGYQQVGEIGAAAGITGASVYHHFVSKSAILDAALTRRLDALMFNLSSAFGAPSPAHALDHLPATRRTPKPQSSPVRLPRRMGGPARAAPARALRSRGRCPGLRDLIRDHHCPRRPPPSTPSEPERRPRRHRSDCAGLNHPSRRSSTLSALTTRIPEFAPASGGNQTSNHFWPIATLSDADTLTRPDRTCPMAPMQRPARSHKVGCQHM